MDPLLCWGLADAVKDKVDAWVLTLPDADQPKYIVDVAVDSLTDVADLKDGFTYIDVIPMDADLSMNADDDRSRRIRSHGEVRCMVLARKKVVGKSATQTTQARTFSTGVGQPLSGLLRATARKPLELTETKAYWIGGSVFISREDLRANSLLSLVWPDVTFRVVQEN